VALFDSVGTCLETNVERRNAGDEELGYVKEVGMNEWPGGEVSKAEELGEGEPEDSRIANEKLVQKLADRLPLTI